MAASGFLRASLKACYTTGMAQTLITPQVFMFLSELACHNRREWFAVNKGRYIDEVRDPLLQFVVEFAPHLRKISRHMVADPRPVGGSLFRIHRDTRFARDKRPYKTHAGLSFRHAGGRDVHGPVFYLHVEPGGVFAAAGMWHPQPEALAKIRDAIVANPKGWQRVRESRACALDAGRSTDSSKISSEKASPPAPASPRHRRARRPSSGASRRPARRRRRSCSS
jgi:uncharacterized protein (TIGR02453 family)